MIYNEQFLQTLSHGVLKGGVEHSELRMIFFEIINALKMYSVFDGTAEYAVLISEVDVPFVEARTKAVLNKELDQSGNYEHSEIFDAVTGHIGEINAFLKAETNAQVGGLLEIYSVAELRRKGLLHL